MTMFTPGPWFATVETNHHGGWKLPEQVIVIGSADFLIAEYVTSFVQYPSDEENSANANLIAAAPDLLAALQRLHKAGGIWPDLLPAVEAAIAKALGEQA